jgi:CBS domain containing-hemolysin-like protein
LVDDAGQPTGYLHIKDVLDIDDDECEYPVPPRRIRALISLEADTDLEDALSMLRRTRSHLARVHDEEGNTMGVLFLEDIIEELVGEVRDATRRGSRAQGV